MKATDGDASPPNNVLKYELSESGSSERSTNYFKIDPETGEPELDDDFEQVPAGLEHYEPLVTTMEEQRVNYDKVSSLPDFTLFTWFFVIAGAFLVILALTGLFVGCETDGAPVSDQHFTTAA